jgi:DNA (cytosine-5)-methyltransferase 1
MSLLPIKTFSDLFAGIGGFRVAAESLGLKCVFSSEIDEAASIVYESNFGERPSGDITKISANSIPSHNILCAGFPCQSFSITGKRMGFLDKVKGTLFFDIARTIKAKKPTAFLLENVSNFASHNNGRTIRTVMGTLSEMGYASRNAIINASDFGIPQARQRIYIVGFMDDRMAKKFVFPQPFGKNVILNDFLLPDSCVNDCFVSRKFKFDRLDPEPDMFGKYPQMPFRIGYVAGMEKIQGYRIYSPMGHAVTISAQGGGAFPSTGGYRVNDKIRVLHPRECARIMGFPDSFTIPKSHRVAYRLLGNSVVVPVIRAILAAMVKVMQQ